MGIYTKDRIYVVTGPASRNLTWYQSRSPFTRCDGHPLDLTRFSATNEVKGLLQARGRYRRLHGLRESTPEGARVTAGANGPEGLYLDLPGALLGDTQGFGDFT